MRSINARELKALKRRRAFLWKRIGMSDEVLSYDMQEAAALDTAIKYFEDQQSKIEFYGQNVARESGKYEEEVQR